MLIPEKIRQENIAEYIIYMYMFEDVVRAFQFNQDRIVAEYFRPQLPDDSFVSQYGEWVNDVVTRMKREGIEKEGHLSQLKEMMAEFNFLHNLLSDVLKEQKYIDLYDRTLPVIQEFSQKANMSSKTPVEIAFHSQYMKLLMKLKRDEISKETEEAFDQMRIFVSYLSDRYKKMQQEN